MKKAGLIEAVATECGYTKKDAEKVVNDFFALVQETLCAGERVQISGFGVFETRERKARVGHNPQNGESIKIAAARVPAFRPGSVLKDAVR
ncbi:MAG: HU family DNA-binding protein [Syntrophomonadaceae bacterium]|nr:HU family DNA-binding protein [Syntrophomonadaceae bacterium]